MYWVMWRSYIDVSEPAVGQLWPSVFDHSEWKHLVCFVMADEETSLWKYGRGVWLKFVLNLGRAVMKHLKCYGKHVVLKHLAVLQYFSGGGTSKTVTCGWSTKHVLASAVLWCAQDDLTALGSPWADSERRLLWKRPENPFSWSHEEEKTGFAQETVVFASG